MTDTADTVEVNDADVLRVVDRDAQVEQVCTGFQFSEGPIWNPREQCLYFSDMPNDIRRRWSPDGGVVEVRNPSNKCNGMPATPELKSPPSMPSSRSSESISGAWAR